MRTRKESQKRTDNSRPVGEIKSEWENELIAALKTYTPEERQIYNQIFAIVENKVSFSDPKFLDVLKNKRQIIEKILSLRVFNEVLTPYGKSLFLGIDQVELVKDQVRYIHEITEVTEYLDALEAGLNRGDIVGLRELAFVAYETTKRLEMLANKYPEYVAIVAREYSTWPILAALSKSKLLKKWKCWNSSS